MSVAHADMAEAYLDRSGGSNPSEKAAPKTLRELRHEHGITLTQAAELAKLHKARISELERGVRWPTRDELSALGYVYGVELGVGFSVIVIEDAKS